MHWVDAKSARYLDQQRRQDDQKRQTFEHGAEDQEATEDNSVGNVWKAPQSRRSPGRQ